MVRTDSKGDYPVGNLGSETSVTVEEPVLEDAFCAVLSEWGDSCECTQRDRWKIRADVSEFSIRSVRIDDAL